MVGEDQRQLPAELEPAAKGRSAPVLEKAGWSLLGIAVALWGLAFLLLVYGASSRTGWGLLVAFVTLILTGFGLIVTGGPIERSLLRWHPFASKLALSPADRVWAEQWDELMRRPVR